MAPFQNDAAPPHKAAARTLVALGLRAHSGWAALVAIAGSPGSPKVIERRRIELTAPGIVRQPYHAVEGLSLKKADHYIRRCISGTKLLARKAFRSVIKELEGNGYGVVACGVLLASGRPLPKLVVILGSHPLLHTAEGELFRNALIHAGECCGLSITRVRERGLFASAESILGFTAGDLQRRIAEMGRPIGPPWSQDQKFAALAAWLALSELAPRRR